MDRVEPGDVDVDMSDYLLGIDYFKPIPPGEALKTRRIERLVQGFMVALVTGAGVSYKEAMQFNPEEWEGLNLALKRYSSARRRG